MLPCRTAALRRVGWNRWAWGDRGGCGSLVFGLILLMAEILHQLRLVVDPITCRVLYIPGGDRRISAMNSSWSGEWLESLDRLDHFDPLLKAN